MISSIPEVTVLGAIRFVIFINDMPEEVKYNVCKLFADDCKLYGRVRTREQTSTRFKQSGKMVQAMATIIQRL